MSDSRKLFLAFAVVALMLGTVASAQVTPPITCSTTAQPLTVRTEGLSEQVGDTIISCTGGAVPAIGTTLPQVNISVTLSTNITSRLLNDPITEALLFVDDPQPGAQNPCAPASGSTVCQPLTAGPGGAALDSAGVVRNVFQGVRQNDTTIVFLAVPINAPGTTTSRIFRIKNVRAAVAGASAANGQIVSYVSIQNPPANLQLNNSTVTVGFVQQGLAFSLRSKTGGSFSSTATGVYYYACDTWNNDLANANTNRFGGASKSVFGGFSLRYREGYAASWKVRDVNNPLTEPGLQQNFPQNNNGADVASGARKTVESGFFNTGFTSINGLNRAGRADHGTRLRARFSGVPANVRVYVSAGVMGNANNTSAECTGISSTSTQAYTCSGTYQGETSPRLAAYGVSSDANGANVAAGTVLVNPLSDALLGLGNSATAGVLYPSGAAQGLVEVPITSGAGAFTWEVFNEDPSAIDTASFLVVFAFRQANNPGVGVVNVNGSFAPISTVNTMSASAPIPRFQDTSTATAGPSLNTCATNLLFPFVTNQGGFDTGIALANTSQDPFGTSPQSGTCTVYYYGKSSGGGAAPAPQTTTSALNGGDTAVFTLSSGGTNGIQSTPGFQGYLIATCNFRYAHGFAFISDVGAQKLAMGYIALVMDVSGIGDSVTGRTPVIGEVLGQ